jgi:hypothetical protein
VAGIPNDHFQKFLICSTYVKPYGLLSGGKIFTEFESAMMVDNLTENRINIDKTDMTIKKKDILFNL